MAETLHRLFSRWPLPWLGLVITLQYFLGLGLARYLGASLEPLALWGGWLLVLALGSGGFWLAVYFSQPRAFEPLWRVDPRMEGGTRLRFSTPAQLAAGVGVSYALAASLSVLLYAAGHFSPALLLFVGLGVLGSLAYGLPPVRLAGTAFGELTAALLVVVGTPAVAFVLQMGAPHRLLLMTTAPLFCLFWALLLVFELVDYAVALKEQRRNLVTLMGWENAMHLHNILALGAFVLLGLAALFGLPRFGWFPAGLLVLFAAAQVWLMGRVAAGAKPNWNLLVFQGVLLYAALAYLLAYGFWVN